MRAEPQIAGLRGFSICVLLLSVLSAAHAQKTDVKTKEAPAIELSAIQLGQFAMPELFYAVFVDGPDGKPKKEFRTLPVSNGARGAVTRIPFVQPLALYTASPDSADAAKMKSYVEIPARSAGDKLLLLFYADRHGQPQRIFLDDSPSAHPEGSVRMVNLTSGRVAFSAGGPSIPVDPGASALGRPVLNADGRFPFIHIEERPGEKSYTAPTKLLRFNQPGQRMLVVFALMPAELATGEQRPDGSGGTKTVLLPEAYRMFDRLDTGARKAPQPTPPSPSADGATAARAPAVKPERELAIIALPGTVAEWSKVTLKVEGSAPQQETLRGDNFARMRFPAGSAASFQVEGAPSLGGALDGAGSKIIIIRPGVDIGASPLASILENSLQSHPAGTVRILNLTPYMLSYMAGSEVHYVPPQENQIIAPPAGPDAFVLKIAVKGASGWKMLADKTQARPEAGTRRLMLVYKSPGKDEFSVVELTQ